MPRATIIGLNYAPEPAGNAPYTASLASFLTSTGWAVDVVTGYPHYPEWRKTAAPSHEMRDGVSIRRRSHYVPKTPTTLGRGLMELTWYVNALPTALTTKETDVVLGIVPSLSGAWLALAAARRARAPCVLWFQDLMGQAALQSGIGGGGKVARIVQWLELSVARRCDTALVVAEGYTPYLLNGGVAPDRIHTIPNWALLPPASRTRQEARAHFGLGPSQPVVLHSGNMGLKQGLDIVIDVAQRMPDTTFVLQGNGSERTHLEERVESMQLPNVVFLPTLSAKDLADLLACADILLLTQRPSVTDMSLPSKLTSYLASGTPIVAAVNDSSEASSLLKNEAVGTCVAAGEVQALADCLQRVFDRATSSTYGSTSPRPDAAMHGNSGPAAIERTLRALMIGSDRESS